MELVLANEHLLVVRVSGRKVGGRNEVEEEEVRKGDASKKGEVRGTPSLQVT